MSDQPSRIAEDLFVKVCGLLDETTERELNIAKHVLPGKEMGWLSARIAISTSLAMIGVIIQHRRDEVEAGDLFDLTLTAIVGSIQLKKATLLATIEQHEARCPRVGKATAS